MRAWTSSIWLRIFNRLMGSCRQDMNLQIPLRQATGGAVEVRQGLCTTALVVWITWRKFKDRMQRTATSGPVPLLPCCSKYRLCGPAVRLPDYKSRDPGLDSRRYRIFWEVVGLERGPLSLVSTKEELIVRKRSGSSLENREYGRRDPLC
jgi:hypothetical protein